MYTLFTARRLQRQGLSWQGPEAFGRLNFKPIKLRESAKKENLCPFLIQNQLEQDMVIKFTQLIPLPFKAPKVVYVRLKAAGVITSSCV
jgi:hypothetical protein